MTNFGSSKRSYLGNALCNSKCCQYFIVQTVICAFAVFLSVRAVGSMPLIKFMFTEQQLGDILQLIQSIPPLPDAPETSAKHVKIIQACYSYLAVGWSFSNNSLSVFSIQLVTLICIPQ